MVLLIPQNRNISAATMAKYGIGYSSMNWQYFSLTTDSTTQINSHSSDHHRVEQLFDDNFKPTPLAANVSVINYLLYHNFRLEDIIASGLLAKSSVGPYFEKFRYIGCICVFIVGLKYCV
jgi:hypothetical protein